MAHLPYGKKMDLMLDELMQLERQQNETLKMLYLILNTLAKEFGSSEEYEVLKGRFEQFEVFNPEELEAMKRD